jgi:hypothetical protein
LPFANTSGNGENASRNDSAPTLQCHQVIGPTGRTRPVSERHMPDTHPERVCSSPGGVGLTPGTSWCYGMRPSAEATSGSVRTAASSHLHRRGSVLQRLVFCSSYLLAGQAHPSSLPTHVCRTTAPHFGGTFDRAPLLRQFSEFGGTGMPRSLNKASTGFTKARERNEMYNVRIVGRHSLFPAQRGY